MTIKRAFSPSEVNELVPSLQRAFQKLEALKREIGARSNELERLGANAPRPIQAPEPEDIVERRALLQRRVTEFQAEIDEIERLGGILRDLDLGQVDFPAVIDGSEVLLVWHYGETEVTHYYRPEESRRHRIAAG